MEPLEIQVAGGHYKSLPIQPIEFIMENELPYAEGNVVKYISRHKEKGGAEDVKKAIHYCEFILKYVYHEGEE